MSEDSLNDLIYIKKRMEGFDDLNKKLDSIDVRLVSMDKSLDGIDHSLSDIKDLIKGFLSFTSGNIKYVFGGFFVIILLAMGIKEIPNIFK